MPYPLKPFTGRVWRLINPKWQTEPFSGQGAMLRGGRWNAIGSPALYVATDPTTAISEYYQGIAKPGMLAPYDLTASAIADLTDGKGQPADARIRGALAADWKTIARIDGGVPPSWTLAQELIDAAADGALVPAVQQRGGTNLVLWRWHDARESGTGAALTLLDPERVLAGR